MTTTMVGAQSEWTAAPLRVIARWVPVGAAGGRTTLEMRWSEPAVEAPDEADATGTSSAA